MARTVSLREFIFALNASTSIPPSPVAGNSYRNSSVAEATINNGWSFATVIESAAFNELMYRLTSVIKEIEQNGVLDYSTLVNYSPGSIVKRAPGNIIYQCRVANGPGTGAGTKDPTNPTYWVDYLDSVEPYSLPTASGSVKGGVKIGSGLTMVGDTLKASAYSLPTASGSVKGGVRVGSGLTMVGETLNASAYSLPTASGFIKGGVKVGSGLTMVGEALSVAEKAIAAFGAVSPAGAKLCGSANWTVVKNKTGKYQLNITDAGNYIVIANLDTEDSTPYADHIQASHDGTTGFFKNNTAENMWTVRESTTTAQDSKFFFLAIKI